ncbi:hypothetical protein Trydic_g20, partial [Trypoxylus dichotomus]
IAREPPFPVAGREMESQQPPSVAVRTLRMILHPVRWDRFSIPSENVSTRYFILGKRSRTSSENAPKPRYISVATCTEAIRSNSSSSPSKSEKAEGKEGVHV